MVSQAEDAVVIKVELQTGDTSAVDKTVDALTRSAKGLTDGVAHIQTTLRNSFDPSIPGNIERAGEELRYAADNLKSLGVEAGKITARFIEETGEMVISQEANNTRQIKAQENLSRQMEKIRSDMHKRESGVMEKLDKQTESNRLDMHKRESAVLERKDREEQKRQGDYWKLRIKQANEDERNITKQRDAELAAIREQEAAKVQAEDDRGYITERLEEGIKGGQFAAPVEAFTLDSRNTMQDEIAALEEYVTAYEQAKKDVTSLDSALEAGQTQLKNFAGYKGKEARDLGIKEIRDQHSANVKERREVNRAVREQYQAYKTQVDELNKLRSSFETEYGDYKVSVRGAEADELFDTISQREDYKRAQTQEKRQDVIQKVLLEYDLTTPIIKPEEEDPLGKYKISASTTPQKSGERKSAERATNKMDDAKSGFLNALRDSGVITAGIASAKFLEGIYTNSNLTSSIMNSFMKVFGHFADLITLGMLPILLPVLRWFVVSVRPVIASFSEWMSGNKSVLPEWAKKDWTLKLEDLAGWAVGATAAYIIGNNLTRGGFNRVVGAITRLGIRLLPLAGGALGRGRLPKVDTTPNFPRTPRGKIGPDSPKMSMEFDGGKPKTEFGSPKGGSLPTEPGLKTGDVNQIRNKSGVVADDPANPNRSKFYDMGQAPKPGEVPTSSGRYGAFDDVHFNDNTKNPSWMKNNPALNKFLSSRIGKIAMGGVMGMGMMIPDAMELAETFADEDAYKINKPNWEIKGRNVMDAMPLLDRARKAWNSVRYGLPGVLDPTDISTPLTKITPIVKSDDVSARQTQYQDQMQEVWGNRNSALLKQLNDRANSNWYKNEYSNPEGMQQRLSNMYNEVMTLLAIAREAPHKYEEIKAGSSQESQRLLDSLYKIDLSARSPDDVVKLRREERKRWRWDEENEKWNQESFMKDPQLSTGVNTEAQYLLRPNPARDALPGEVGRDKGKWAIKGWGYGSGGTGGDEYETQGFEYGGAVSMADHVGGLLEELKNNQNRTVDDVINAIKQFGGASATYNIYLLDGQEVAAPSEPPTAPDSKPNLKISYI